MNTKNNLDNEKLPVNEEQDDRMLQSESPAKDSTVEYPQAENSAAEEADEDILAETADIASVEVNKEELSEDVKEVVGENVTAEGVFEEEIVSEEVATEDTASKEVPIEEVISEDIPVEEKSQEEAVVEDTVVDKAEDTV